jgi:coenzyme F420-0:L-glutamate ligase/coenzyme F420-1:gamma-L-glutamate ligase
MELVPLVSRLARSGEDLPQLILDSLSQAGVDLRDGDVLAIADKVVAVSEGRTRDLSQIVPSEEAVRLADEFSLEPSYVQLVMQEADRIVGGVEHALLTISRGIMIANAGIDRKNAPPGTAVLWPEDSYLSADRIREVLEEASGVDLGILIVDSRVCPLRKGTTGLCVAYSGFRGVEDLRGEPDIYGRPLRITYFNVADDLAAAAHLLMGERDEQTPFVLVRSAPVELTSERQEDTRISEDRCLFMSNLTPRDKWLADWRR